MKNINTIVLMTTISLTLLTACSKKEANTPQNSAPTSAATSHASEASTPIQSAVSEPQAISENIALAPNETHAVPHYQGIPKSDPQFAQFLSKNKGKVVQLDLTIEDPNDFDDITQGYKGVSPTFYVASVGQTDYEVYIDCDQIANQESDTTIGQCSPAVTWDTRTGHLTGQFKIQSKGKNDMGSMLYYLVAVK